MKDVTPDGLQDLLAEADRLIASIEGEFGEHLEEDRRERLTSGVEALQAGREKVAGLSGDGDADAGSRPSSGIHEAIDDLIAAIKETTRLLG